jgi:hypothetical protein
VLVYWFVGYSLRLPGLARWFVSLLKVGETWAYKEGAMPGVHWAGIPLWCLPELDPVGFFPVPGMVPGGVVPPGCPRRCCKRAW